MFVLKIQMQNCRHPRGCKRGMMFLELLVISYGLYKFLFGIEQSCVQYKDCFFFFMQESFFSFVSGILSFDLSGSFPSEGTGKSWHAHGACGHEIAKYFGEVFSPYPRFFFRWKLRWVEVSEVYPIGKTPIATLKLT